MESNVIEMPQAETAAPPTPEEMAAAAGGRVVEGAEVQSEIRQRMAHDPWLMAAAGASTVINDIIGQIDLKINYSPDVMNIKVPTGNRLEDGTPELREIPARVADSEAVQCLAQAAEALTKVHDYAMRRSSKARNTSAHGKKR